jgi:hypothetical protein
LPSDSLQETIAQERERETSAQFFIKVEKSKKAKKSDKIMANINISETSTFTLLDIASICVSNEEPHAEVVSQNNQKYLEVSLLINFFQLNPYLSYIFSEQNGS